MPVWVGVGVSAGLGLWGAKKQSDASKQAAQTQTNAGNQALALQAGIYNQTRNDLAPYRGAGTAALGSEMSLLGLNPSAMGSLGGGPSTVGADSSAGGTQYGTHGVPGLPDGTLVAPGGAQMPGGGGAVNGSTANNPNASSYPGYTPHNNPVPTLKFQHSDGTVYQIPADQVAEAQKQDPQGKVLGQA